MQEVIKYIITLFDEENSERSNIFIFPSEMMIIIKFFNKGKVNRDTKKIWNCHWKKAISAPNFCSDTHPNNSDSTFIDRIKSIECAQTEEIILN